MLIKQISVFIENKAGTVGKIIEIIGSNDINISALSIADTTDFGILRLIVDDPYKAAQILTERDFVVKTTDVISIGIENKPGSLINILDTFKDNNIAIDYMYAFVNEEDNAVTILKTDDIDLAVQKLVEKGIK
ncbi:MAG: acetolactate synthase [Eubacteriales bacterium]|nr:acetolactate synthase [Eubacteriales bacterium]